MKGKFDKRIFKARRRILHPGWWFLIQERDNRKIRRVKGKTRRNMTSKVCVTSLENMVIGWKNDYPKVGKKDSIAVVVQREDSSYEGKLVLIVAESQQ